ncbi:hypothetical protein RSOLAG22IIIB_08500 [Rhizoctonia solani]|uniref:Uncharacterized protein n=1 Tax=Rhizoctonia solani TaxID=456999 RepID=A0A0K6FTQ6_9AGAM|nr:hypothetical protein RSOLAG22IIIB_08500 [Rhizoctonia solani]
MPVLVMTDRPGWYPPTQICYPPELPTYLRNVYDLKPIVGVPIDADVIGIHAVVQAANRVSGAPGMHDPSLLMGLAGHLFSVQMAKYRSKFSLVTSPSDATYTPPKLPAHVSIKLEPVSGAPSDDEMMKAQEVPSFYRQFSHAPSMFDVHVNMELSQHLFNLQMARYMRHAGESQPGPAPQSTTRPECPVRAVDQMHSVAGLANSTNNAGTGAQAIGACQSQSPPCVEMREMMDRSNQLTERFNWLLECSNESAERYMQSTYEAISQTSSERLDHLLKRLTLVEQSAEQPNPFIERFNQLFERLNRLVEQSNQSAQKANMHVFCKHSSSSPTRIFEKNPDNIKLPNADTSNAELLIHNVEVHASARPIYYVDIHDTLKQSSGIAEHANRLIEHSVEISRM